MDFDSNDLSQTWRRWKEEMELYLELAMAGQQEATEEKLVLYLIGSQGREIYNTLNFESSKEERTVEDVLKVKEFPEVFAGTGKFDGTGKLACTTLEIDPTVKRVVHPSRVYTRVPAALNKQLKEELSRLEQLGILKEVTSPTLWVSSMFVARKPYGNLQICIDPKDLNEVLKRSHYPIPTIDEVLPEITRARMFSTFNVRKRILAR